MSAIALAGNMIDPGGGPAAGCKLTSCIRGTSTPSPLYSDVGLATRDPNHEPEQQRSGHKADCNSVNSEPPEHG